LEDVGTGWERVLGNLCWSNGMGVVWLHLAQDTNKWHALGMREMVWSVGGGGVGRVVAQQRRYNVRFPPKKPNVDGLFPFTGTVTDHTVG
jgi:hypothetical protein